MKRIITSLCVLTLAVLAGCSSWVDPDMNKDPNNPTSASYNVVLPTVQAGLAYAQGGDLGRFASLLTQHNEGVDRQHLGIYQYTFTESDIDNVWRFNLYAGPLADLEVMIRKADADGSYHYRGVCKILRAYTMCTITDLWGDVPYAEALQGGVNRTPSYETQQDLYNTLLASLDSAITDLAGTTAMKPGSDDLVYGGDVTKWTKFAHTLMARMYLHLAERRSDGYAKALEHVRLGLGAGDNGVFTFGDVETAANPWYQFNTQRGGDLVVGPKLLEIMNGTSDPRLPLYANANDSGKYEPGTCVMGPLFSSINSPVPFMTFFEAKFIEAEAAFQTGDRASANAAYVAGITASMAWAGVSTDDISAFLANTAVNPGENNLTLEHIMTQKYVAMYTQPESFADWRRTSLPALTPVTGDQVPRRFPYPQYERLYNGENVPPGQTIYTRVWWDM